jgi:hypothetical protein
MTKSGKTKVDPTDNIPKLIKVGQATRICVTCGEPFVPDDRKPDSAIVGWLALHGRMPRQRVCSLCVLKRILEYPDAEPEPKSSASRGEWSKGHRDCPYIFQDSPFAHTHHLDAIQPRILSRTFLCSYTMGSHRCMFRLCPALVSRPWKRAVRP